MKEEKLMPEPNQPGSPVAFDLQAALVNPESRAALMAWQEEQTRGLKTALEEHKRFKERYVLRKDESTGQIDYIDPEEARKALENRTKPDNGKAKTGDEAAIQEALKAKEAEIRADYERRHKAQLDPLSKELESKNKTIRELLIDNAVKSGINGRVRKEGARAAEYLIKQSLDVIENNGVPVAVVKDADGKPRWGKQGYLTVQEYLDEWAQSEEGKFFIIAPENAGGGDAARTGRPGSGAGKIDYSALTDDEILKTANEQKHGKI